MTCSPRSSVVCVSSVGWRAKIWSWAARAELGAHVDHFDDGERARLHALEHFDARVAAALGVVPGFERGCCTAEDDGDAEKFCAHDSDVAGVVARCFFLLVAAVVLFVDENR